MKTLYCIVFILIVLVGQVRSSESVYAGEPESYWIDLLTNVHSASFVSEWRTLGTNMVPVLIKAVEVQDGKNAVVIRTNAATMLSQIRDPQILLPIARQTADPKVKTLMLNGLTFDADGKVTEIMVKSLGDKDPMVRKAAVVGLGLSARQFIQAKCRP